MSMVLGLGVIREIANQQRSWTNNAHIPLYNIKRFGQLIQTGSPKKSAILVQTYLIRKEIAVLIFSVVHRSEFNKLKNFFVFPRSLLRKKRISSHENYAKHD